MSSIAAHSPSMTTLPLAAQTTTSGATSSTGTSAGSNQTSLSSLGSTFMTLLVQELQNQDPTAPMDSTAMVGQMISLNQLDQIASINQLLTNALTGTSSSGASSLSSTTYNASLQQAAAAAANAASRASLLPMAVQQPNTAVRLPSF